MIGRKPSAEVGQKALASCLLSLIRPATPVGFSKVRIGNQHGDGGYVMVDDWRDVRGAISIGIGGDVSWDLAIAERGIDVYQYDHSVPSPPIRHPRFHFHSVGIGNPDSGHSGFRSLEQIVGDIPPGGDLILKMDVEGAEWATLSSARSQVLERFSQIVIEVHAPLAGTAGDRMLNLQMLGKLRSTHQVVHVHANNYAAVDSFDGIRVPNVLEISYLRRTRTSFRTSRERLPSADDAPNDPLRPEIEMSSILAQARDPA